MPESIDCGVTPPLAVHDESFCTHNPAGVRRQA